jgi:hypothetical protein
VLPSGIYSLFVVGCGSSDPIATAGTFYSRTDVLSPDKRDAFDRSVQHHLWCCHEIRDAFWAFCK